MYGGRPFQGKDTPIKIDFLAVRDQKACWNKEKTYIKPAKGKGVRKTSDKKEETQRAEGKTKRGGVTNEVKKEELRIQEKPEYTEVIRAVAKREIRQIGGARGV